MPKTVKPVKAFRLDAPTIEALRYMATKDKRSEAQIIQMAVEEYFLNHYGPELEKIIEKGKVE